MPRIISLIGSLLLIASTGFTEVLITAQDYAVDSDVVLESAVKEIKSAPQDTINVVGDSVKYVADETVTTAKGVAAVFKKDLHAKTKKAAELEIENAWVSSNDILFRSYKVTDQIGDELTQGAEIATGDSVDVSAAFPGLEFPRGTSVFYRPDFNKLFVRQTLENILSIEDVLAEQHSASRELIGHQVEIETRFVEVNQSTLNELGFDWTFTSKGGSASPNAGIAENLILPAGQDLFSQGLRTASTALGVDQVADTIRLAKTAGSLRWEVMISALEQSDDSDVLCAPRVVTRDGTTATIQVGEEQMIPKAFDVNNQDLSPWVEHTDWDLELIGVRLEVTPELRNDGLIDLEIIPTIKELIGYDSYQVLPTYNHLKQSANYTQIDSLEASLPYFRIREMEARVTVADGSTVGMGGLIYDKLETFRDKVPLLGSIPLVGRLFRSEGEKSIKRNLMIFVTATQVDINGRKSSELALRK